MLSEKANIYGEETFAQAYVDIESNLITASERLFVQSYANASFENLITSSSSPKMAGCDKERLTLLDWFYSFSQAMKITDRELVLQAVELLDKQPVQDRLTAIVCFYIQSKYCLTDLTFTMADVLHVHGFKEQEFLKREFEVRKY